MRQLAAICACVSLVTGATTSAQNQRREILNSFTLEPVALDSENTGGTSIGLAFDLDATFIEKNLDTTDAGSIEIDANARVGGVSLNLTARGTVTQDSLDNPKDLVETRLSGNYFSSRGNENGSLTLLAGGFLKYEADQDFDDKQLVYGGTITLGRIDLLAENDVFSVQANVGRVDPSQDAERRALLGGELERYTRADLELLYIYPFRGESTAFDTFELNYRYFRELSAPAAVEAAGADSFKLATYRLGFGNGLFVAYSTGKLPFDRSSDQIVELGFSYDVKR